MPNFQDFRSALEEEKEDHAKTSNLLQEIQKELNDANKKISKLRNDIEVLLNFLMKDIIAGATSRIIFCHCYTLILRLCFKSVY